MGQEVTEPIPAAIARIAPDGRPTPRQRRRIMIEMGLRRINPGTFSPPEFLQRRTAMNPWPDLRPVLKEFPWAITGAVATRAYMPERMTRDVDILVRREDCRAVWKRFQAAGYSVAPVLDAPYFLARTPEGVQVGVMCADFPWVTQALADTRSEPAGYPVLALPYLILMKLKANRGIDIGDMTRMLGLASKSELDEVRDIVSRFAPEDSDDLQGLILLCEMEFRERQVPGSPAGVVEEEPEN